MEWCLIEKTANPAIEGSNFNHRLVKEFVRQESGMRCVYCAIHENALGGVRAFHVEHYRPKTRFPELERSLSNLFYACPICNQFKYNDWPADPDTTLAFSCYPDPSAVDYSSLFEVTEENGMVQGHYVASKYMIERLYFNRPQLILERRKYYLDQELTSLHTRGRALIQALGARTDQESRGHLVKIADFSARLSQLRIDLDNIPSYESADVSRPRT